MKNLRLFLTAVVFGIVMVACSNTDSLIDDLEKAANKGDYAKVEKICEKLKKKDLTNEQQLRIVKITTNLGVKMIGDVNSEIKNANSVLDDLDDEEDFEDEDFDDDLDW